MVGLEVGFVVGYSTVVFIIFYKTIIKKHEKNVLCCKIFSPNVNKKAKILKLWKRQKLMEKKHTFYFIFVNFYFS